MFAYCRNNPVNNADHSGYLGICVLEDPMNLFRAFTTPGMFGSGGGAGGCVAGVSSSYYASQNVKTMTVGGEILAIIRIRLGQPEPMKIPATDIPLLAE